MVQGADDRRLVSAARQIHLGHAALDELRSDNLAVDAEVLVHLGAPALRPQRGRGMSQREMAALGKEQVEVERPRQILKQIEADLVEASAFGREVVGADDSGVAAGAA